MKYLKKNRLLVLSWIVFSFLNLTSCSEESETTDDSTTTDEEVTVGDDGEVVLNVDSSLFHTDEGYVTITTVPCTLSDGTETECYQIISEHIPTDHEMGPWCPEYITDGPEAGGVWIESGETFDVDGAFIENLAEFYGDTTWKMYDEVTGEVFRLKTREECLVGADPNIEEESMNMCAQCLPGWIEAEGTYLIPVTPIKLDTSTPLTSPILEGDGPLERGIAFNGVRFDHPAGLDVILAGYQIAPLDNAGGHINNALGYHYHGEGGFSTRIEQTDNHAGMIGYAMDGHGLYEQLDIDGNEPTGLDDCRGHYDDTRGYHYHSLPLASNEFFECIYGAFVIVEDEDDNQGGEGGPPPN